MRVLLSGLSTDRVELRLAEELRRAGIDLEVIAEPGTPAVERCRNAGIPFVTHHYTHRFDRGAIQLYRERWARQPCDIMHCLSNRSLSTALLATRRLSRPPKIIGYRGTMGHLQKWNPASRMSYLSRRVDAIICVSEAVRGYLTGMGVPEHRLETIWKGHDPSWYAPAPRTVFTEWGIPADAFVVVFTGNIRPVKGADVLLKAFAGITPGEGIHLLLAGEVRERRIARQIGRYPHIHFTGFRADAPALAGAADLGVIPSVEREGLPKAALEAMAQGVPLVVTRVGGLPELVEDGVHGLVVPPRDPRALHDAIRKMAADRNLRMAMGLAARKRVEQEFNFRHTLEKTAALYAKLTRES